MALPTLSALKSQKTSAAATRVFGQNQEFESPRTEAISRNLLKTMSDFFSSAKYNIMYCIFSFETFINSKGGNHSANCMGIVVRMRKQHLEEEMARSQGVISLR